MALAAYLKRYLPKDEQNCRKKKKVKHPKTAGHVGLQIIDDDVDINKLRNEKTFEEDDDIPEIVEFLEKEKQRRDNFIGHNWVSCDGDDDVKIKLPIPEIKKEFDGDDRDSHLLSTMPEDALMMGSIKQEPMSPESGQAKISNKRRHDSSSDASPPRNDHHCDSDPSPPRRSEVTERSRRRNRRDSTNKTHDDPSPPRNSQRYDSDPSPPRMSEGPGHSKQKRHNSTTDGGRRIRQDSSPPRSDDQKRRLSKRGRTRHNSSSSRKEDHYPLASKRQKTGRDPTPDLSPPRKDGRSLVASPATSRRTRQDSDPDISPPRRDCSQSNRDDRSQRRRRRRHDSDSSTEGGRNAHKDKSGTDQGGKVIQRDKLGRKRNFEEEKRKKDEEDAKKKIIEDKYKEWGRGLKQKEVQEMRMQDFMKESDKPLARFADDADLNEELRNAERESDPMLEYMRRKKAKAAGLKGKALPAYTGPEPPPNRFNIRPGYRWDGVDRSTGFENQFFATQSEDRANKFLAYKWNSEDM